MLKEASIVEDWINEGIEKGIKSAVSLRSILKKGLKTNDLNELKDFIAKKKK